MCWWVRDNPAPRAQAQAQVAALATRGTVNCSETTFVPLLSLLRESLFVIAPRFPAPLGPVVRAAAFPVSGPRPCPPPPLPIPWPYLLGRVVPLEG